MRANPLLRSWDGAFLLPWTGKVAGFNTSALSLNQVEVSSELAAAATDGVWRSTLQDPSGISRVADRVHECPSDCLVNVSFQNQNTDSMDTDLLAEHFCLVRNASKWGGKCRPVKVIRRDGINGFTLIPPQPLQFDTVYNITLPKGVVVSNVSGPTKADITVQISGLRPFEFNFIQGQERAVIQSTQVSLFVRHGLPEGTATVSQIQQAIAVLAPDKRVLPAVVHRKHNDLTLIPSKTELR